MSSCHQCNAPNATEIAVAWNNTEETKWWCVPCWNAHAAIVYADCVIVETEGFPCICGAEDNAEMECECECDECGEMECECGDEAEGYDTGEEEAMAEQTGDYSYLEAHLKAKEDKKKDDDKTK